MVAPVSPNPPVPPPFYENKELQDKLEHLRPGENRDQIIEDAGYEMFPENDPNRAPRPKNP